VTELKGVFEEKIQKVKYQLADQIRKSREEMGVSQVELARRMGVTQPLISRMEKGESLPREETLVRIARALGLSQDHFLENAGRSSSPQSGEIMEKLCHLQQAIDKIHDKLESIPSHGISPQKAPEARDTEAEPVKLAVVSIDMRGHLVSTGEMTLPRNLAGSGDHILKVGDASLEPFILEGEMLILGGCAGPPDNGRLCLLQVEGEGHMVGFYYSDKDRAGIGRSLYDARWFEKDKVIIKGISLGRFSPAPVISQLEDWAREH